MRPDKGWSHEAGVTQRDDQLWYTEDGGETWEIRTAPLGRRAMAFVDAQQGWAVGEVDLRNGRRTTIAYTKDGGRTWQMQDTRIEMPSLLYTSVARLTPFLGRQTPPTEALLAQALLAPCIYDGRGWLPYGMLPDTSIVAMMFELGWDGSKWASSPAVPKGPSDQWPDHWLRVDLDSDGTDEIVILGQGECYGSFAGVLDWDGNHWQVAWLGRAYCECMRSCGDVVVRVEWLDGRPVLMVGMLIYPGRGTGVDVRSWDLTLVECEHLSCRSVWTHHLGGLDALWSYRTSYHWFGTSYQFVDVGEARSDIEVQQYGLAYDRTPETRGTLESVEVEIRPVMQETYRWDGAQYTLDQQSESKPGYELDTTPITETMDLDGDGRAEQVVHRWHLTFWGLQQTLAIYRPDRQEEQPTQVFTATVTGAPVLPISIRTDNGQKEILLCTPPSGSSIFPDESQWPSFQPVCTVYHWSSRDGLFVPVSGED